jgi:large conductance mechanosensitive channel
MLNTPAIVTARSTWQEFRAFLLKQNALALAIGVVIGAALGDIVKAIVDGVIMPVVNVALPKDAAWQSYTLSIGPADFLIGQLAAAVLKFLVVGFVVWRLAKALIKPEPVAEAPVTKKCPHCFMDIAAPATRCAYCTSTV